LSIDEAKEYLATLCGHVEKLHRVVTMHYADAFQIWIEKIALHPLQKIILQKRIDTLR
jgi:hypothetical protein